MIINRQTCKLIAADAQAALAAVAAKHGLSFKYKGGSFSSTTFNLRGEFATIATDGTVLTREARDFALLANAYGLNAQDLGKEFQSPSGTFRVTGLKVSSSKYPILATHVGNGKAYKFPATFVAGQLHPKAA